MLIFMSSCMAAAAAAGLGAEPGGELLGEVAELTDAFGEIEVGGGLGV